MHTTKRATIMASLAIGALAAANPASAQSGNRGLEVIAADKGRVTGEIVADFGSRKWAGATGVDTYTVTNMKAADLMVMNGSISRTPEKSLTYSVKFDLFNPKNPAQLA